MEYPVQIICCYCKKIIRIDMWKRKAEGSHGTCPECFEKVKAGWSFEKMGIDKPVKWIEPKEKANV